VRRQEQRRDEHQAGPETVANVLKVLAQSHDTTRLDRTIWYGAYASAYQVNSTDPLQKSDFSATWGLFEVTWRFNHPFYYNWLCEDVNMIC
jgi:hypothetical protein